MSATGQLLTMLQTIHDLSQDGGVGVSYAQISSATGISIYLLAGKASHLKARGLIERANPDAARREHALFVATAKGRELLRPRVTEPELSETTVQRAVRLQPALATVWAGA